MRKWDGKEPLAWYSENIEKYAAFTRLLHATIENIVRASRIEHLSVASRTKSQSSFAEKIERKSYESESEATDLTGIRVITFIEKDAKAVARLIESSFAIVDANSRDTK